MKAHPLFLSVIFLFFSCERDTDNIDDEDWVNVTYVTPVYQSSPSVETPHQWVYLGVKLINKVPASNEYIDQALINNSHYLDTADSLKTVFELYFSPGLSLTEGKFF